MSEFYVDRNLLVGVLGLQMGLYSESELIAAMRQWIFEKSHPLENILVKLGYLKADRQAFLADIVKQFIAIHGNNPAEGLANLSSFGALKNQLSELGDDEVSCSFTRFNDLRQDREDSRERNTADTLSFHDTNDGKGQRFRIVRRHATGGLGVVSVAEDRELHRFVALKEIQPQLASNPESRIRFQIEAEVTGRLEHPGIVPVYSLGTTERGTPFYVMRFIKGDSLKDAIEQLYRDRASLSAHQYGLALRKLVRRLIDVCNAIEYAHSHGVLHRDLKPGNIMLGRYGETLVVDWGLAKTGAKLPADHADEVTFLPLSGDVSSDTRMGTVVGTAAYMSPEQAEGRLDLLGPVSDVYSLGATLYCILTGVAPIPKLSHEEMLQKARTGNFRKPRELNPSIPPTLEAICLKAMSRQQADRYPNTAAFATELELWLAGEPVTAYREPALDRLYRFAKRHRSIVATCTAVLATATVALMIVNLIVKSQNDALKLARDEAYRQQLNAEKYLSDARGLSMTLLSTAEEKLSQPQIDPDGILNLRNSLTEMAYETFSDLYEWNRDDTNLAFEFAQVLRISSNLNRLERRFETAEKRIQQSLQLQIDEDKRQDYLAETYRDVGTLYKAMGKLTRADEAFGAAAQIVQNLLSEFPGNLKYLRTKATIELERVSLLQESGELDAAFQIAENCTEAFKTLRLSEQASDWDDFLFLFSSARLIAILCSLDQHSDAEAIALETIASSPAILAKSPGNPNVLLPYTRVLYWSAEGAADSGGDLNLAQSRIDEAVEILEQLRNISPSPGSNQGLGEALRVKAKLCRIQNKIEEAKAAGQRSHQLLQDLVNTSRTADFLDSLASTIWEQGQLEENSDPPTRLHLMNQAIELQSEACSLSPESKAMKAVLLKMQQDLQGTISRPEGQRRSGFYAAFKRAR